MSRRNRNQLKNNSLSATISAIRHRLGLSQQAFAARLGVTGKYMYKVETGRVRPSKRLLDLMSYKFGIEAMAVVQGQEAANRELETLRSVLAQDNSSANLLALYQELDEAGRDAVFRVAMSERGKGDHIYLLSEAGFDQLKQFLSSDLTGGGGQERLDDPGLAMMATLWKEMQPEERETLRRCAQALRGDDAQVRSHLIGQLKLIEEAISARRREREREASRKPRQTG